MDVSSTQFYVLGANTVNGRVFSSTGNHMTLSERLKPLFLVITSWRELLTFHCESSGNEHYTIAHSYSPFSSSICFYHVLHIFHFFIYFRELSLTSFPKCLIWLSVVFPLIEFIVIFNI